MIERRYYDIIGGNQKIKQIFLEDQVEENADETEDLLVIESIETFKDVRTGKHYQTHYIEPGGILELVNAHNIPPIRIVSNPKNIDRALENAERVLKIKLQEVKRRRESFE